MPHCIIEYSNDIEHTIKPEILMDTVFSATLDSGLFGENQIKTRAISYEHYQIGKEKTSFIHVTSRILSGRTPDQKHSLSQNIFNSLRKTLPERVVTTVDIVDMDKESYSKL